MNNFDLILKNKMDTIDNYLEITKIRDGSVGPVSRYREHFTEIPRRDFKTATLLANTYNGRKS